MGLSISNQLLGSTGLSVGLGLSRGNGLYFGGFGGGAPFTPADLFLNGEQGVWYDPSDFSTLFQDSAGTIPVTAVEQPVGLMLDLSKGLVLGSELVTNGTFDSGTTGWTAAGGTIAVVSGEMQVTRAATTSTAYQAITTVVGVTYKVTGVQRVVTASAQPNIVARTGIDPTLGLISAGTATASSTFVDNTFYFVASGTTTYLHLTAGNAAGVVAFDNITTKSIAGNHATQATSAARPTLSARVNLLTKTEQFDDGAWDKFQSTITANTSATTDPIGTNTADKLIAAVSGSITHTVRQQISTAANTPHTVEVYAKSAEYSRIVLVNCDVLAGTNGAYAVFNLNTGVIDDPAVTYGTGFSAASASITSVGNGWYLCTVTATSTATTRAISCNIDQGTSGPINQTFVGNGTSGYYIWGADLRVANDTALPAYQRVNTATDYDATGFPYYLRFDNVGGDKWMISSTITPGIDKAQCFVGLRRNAITSSYQTVYEYSVNPDANNGVFGLTSENISAGGRLYASSKGTTYAFALPSAGTLNNLTTNVLSHLMDISAPSVSLRADGVSVGASTSTQGTGNFLAYPLYIGRRGGTTTPFNGRFYSIILRFGANLTETQIGQTEQWISNEMGGGYYPTGFDFLVTADGDQLTDASGNPIITQAYYS
jgi:hypothetical protein